MNRCWFISTGRLWSAINPFQTLLFELKPARARLAGAPVTAWTREFDFALKAHDHELLERSLLLRSPGKQQRPGGQEIGGERKHEQESDSDGAGISDGSTFRNGWE
jgi:hypothetical protein